MERIHLSLGPNVSKVLNKIREIRPDLKFYKVGRILLEEKIRDEMIKLKQTGHKTIV